MSRYAIKPFPTGRLFGIYDTYLHDFCGLPIERGGPSWWLQWSTPEQAHHWLDRCCLIWAEWPHSAPLGYGPPAPTPATPKRSPKPKRGTRKRAQGSS